MTPDVIHALSARQPQIRERWAVLLRLEPVTSPLALPDAMVHLIPESLGTILSSLAKTPMTKMSLKAARAIELPVCGCNRNPYLAHFKAGEQALLEAVINVQAELPPTQRNEHDLAEIVCVTRRLAGEEIEAFCGICTHRGESPGCRHHVARA